MIEKIILHKMSGLMQSGAIDAIYVEDGQYVKQGDVIISASAEKANFDIDATKSGYVKLICKAGDELPVGSVLALIGDSLDELSSNQEIDVKINTEQDKKETSIKSVTKEHIKIQPIAKRLAEEHNLDLSNIQGTGPGGIITKTDIENIIKNTKALEIKEIPLSGVKKSMFEHMEKAKNYVQATTFMEVDMIEVKNMRSKKKYSYTCYIIKSVASALKKYPLINSSFTDGKILIKNNINIGVALDYDGQLYVPVIKNTENMSLEDIEKCIIKFREKIKTKNLNIDDISEGTFTVTNSGTFGSSFFAPIINYPQSAILGIAKITEKPVVRDSNVVIRPILIMSLSYDHRIIEGSAAVGFLSEVKDNLENVYKLTGI